MKPYNSLIEMLWARHYEPGLTGSYHGDMALAFQKMLDDRDCNGETREKVRRSIWHHTKAEASPQHTGRRPFSGRFRQQGLGQ